MAADIQVSHTPVQVVPEPGCRAEVISVGDDVWYSRSHQIDPGNVVGMLKHDGRLILEANEPMWFMTGGSARLVVIQQRFCRRCGWVDG